uniref:Uncharacterized protein n=1 Tax=Myoviridae sp. ct0jJ30 TaxID=2825014 RepID=A0A8S5PJF2_9CAUD|nr:MAG TPA: hypothetical protein [Myoviridae sp. ct0jJ30]DAV24002.1 MAG TPA: hypothetical protein [Bacteriophage sp.]
MQAIYRSICPFIRSLKYSLHQTLIQLRYTWLKTLR